ncbi:MAG TPA: ABC transporter permease subunit, partial [Streptosporangiaceae bacterium]|nr:ABC transporter permease subunit [Streptosporangiaceae bacterium]
MTSVASPPGGLSLTSRTAARTRLWSRWPAARPPLGVACACYLVLLIGAVAAAPLLAPYDPVRQDLAHPLSGPGFAHLLGTDQLGRDIASRLLYGGRAALWDVAVAVLTALVVGVPFGLLAGYLGDWADRIIMRAADLIFAIPGIIVLLLVVAIFPGNDLIAMVTLGLVHSAGLSRIVRGSTIACRNDLYVR